MSVQPGEGAPTTATAPETQESKDVVVLPQGDAAFGALMDALVADEEQASGAGAAAAPAEDAGGDGGSGGAAAGDQPAAGAAAGGTADAGGQAAGGDAPVAGATGADAGATAPDAGATGTDAGAATPDAGAATPDAGATGADAGAAATDDGGRPAAWTQSATELIPKLGELSQKLEENTARSYHEAALKDTREEYGKYFEALETHPRLLVGQQVPAIGKEGMETLRDTDDAREWQDAVKGILVEEVKARATKAMEDSSDFLNTLHSSIELFQKNPDLIPTTKDFDVELANRLTTLLKPYEVRVEDKLHGYNIPVQPIVEQLRAALAAERTARASAGAGTPAAPAPPAGAPAPPAGAPAAPAAPAAPEKTADPPQAGIQSKAGESDQGEDFSTLWGTLGLPNLRL